MKANIEMQTFNDGIADIYAHDDTTPLLKYKGIHFERRVVGATRYFAAATVNTEISDLIRIPRVSGLTTFDEVIIGTSKYEIKQIQYILDTNPPCINLSLRFLHEVRGEKHIGT